MRTNPVWSLGLVAALLAIAAYPAAGLRATLLSNYDLDGKAGAVAAIVATATAADSTSYTIAAQPDVPRILEVTVVDADSSITAGVLTVTGLDASGNLIVGTATLTGGSGVKAISPTLYFASVASAITGVLTGEGGAPDTLSLDTDANLTGVPIVFPIASSFRKGDSQGNSTWDVFSWRAETRKAKTTGSSASLTSFVASSGAFTFVSPGDLLLFDVGGTPVERTVLTKADANNVTVETPVDLTAGYAYGYRNLRQLTSAEEGWVSVRNAQSVTFIIEIAQMVGTGGIDDYVQCRVPGSSAPVVNVFQDNLTAAGRTVYSIDLRVRGYDQCRFGLRWATNDDTDDLTTNKEKITLQVSLGQSQ